MICYSDGMFYYLLKLMFSTNRLKGLVALNTNKNLYFTSLGYHKYSQLVTNRNMISTTYLGVFK